MLQIIIKVAPILIPSRFIYACSMPAPALYTLFSSVIWCIVISIFLPRPWPRLLSAPTSISLNYDPRRPAAGDLILILIGFLWIEMWSRIIPAALPSYYTTIFYLYVISVLWHPRNLWVEELQSYRINTLLLILGLSTVPSNLHGRQLYFQDTTNEYIHSCNAMNVIMKIFPIIVNWKKTIDICVDIGRW